MTRGKPYEIIVVGSINTDYMGRGSALPKPGATARGDTFYSGPGGKGANQAVAAARLGGRVALVGKVGGDERGRGLVEHLREEGIDTRHIGCAAQEPSGAAIVQVDDDGEKQILIVQGANARLSAADVHRAESLLRSARVVITQLEVPIEAAAEAIRLGHDAGARVILDPAPPLPLHEDLLSMLHLIRPNADEAEALTGVHVDDRASAQRAAEVLLHRGVGAVAIGVGAQGNLLAWPDDACWYPGIPVKSVDATGAGDAFVGAFAVQMARGRSLAEAGRFANATAALATMKMGAQAGLPTEDAVKHVLVDQGQ